MSYGAVLYYFGLLMLTLAGVAIVPLVTALAMAEAEQVQAFLGMVLITGFAGGAGFLGLGNQAKRDTAREWFLLPVIAWTVLPVFAALPFSYGEVSASLTDAYFEAVSGLTTTGSTVLQGLDQAPRSILLWRALLQWMGGLGSIVLAVSLLSLLGVGGMQLFRSYIPRGEGGSMFARMNHIAGVIVPVYAGLTMLCALALWIAGMTAFEALCHALSTLSTGGFSTRDGSIGAFDSPLIEVVLIFFMALAALNFTLHATAFRDGRRRYREDPEALYLFKIAGVGAVVLAIGLFFSLGEDGSGLGFLPSIRTGVFTAVSVISTTGFVSDGSGAGGLDAGGSLPLPLLPALVVFVLMMIGASTGSTGGGLKVMRFRLLIRQSQRELARLAHPHGVMRVRYGGRGVPDEIMGAIWAFFVLYIFCVAATTLLLTLGGVDFEASLALSAAAVGNSGSSASVISPVAVSDLSAFSKWVLCGAMIMGRLEILTLLTILNPAYWRP